MLSVMVTRLYLWVPLQQSDVALTTFTVSEGHK